jgi:hypothetical protein
MRLQLYLNRSSEAWNGRVTAMIETSEGDLPIYYLGIKELLRNKEASGRPKDLDDLSFLKKLK